jgi:hypothetical protein
LPLVPVSAEELAKEWKTDKAATLAKYKDKRLEVSGIVQVATNDTSVNLPMVQLTNNGVDKTGRVSVSCLFLNKDAQQVADLCEGQTVKVRGQLFDAESAEAMLLNCELVESGPNPAITTSAQELAKEYQADKEKMVKKYDSRWVILEGFVTEIDRPKWKRYDVSKNAPPVEVSDEHCYRFYFNSGADHTIRVCAVCCSYHNDSLLQKYAAVAKGQKIKVRGRCDKTVWRETKMIELTQGVLLD